MSLLPSVNFNESSVFTALRAFILNVCSGTGTVQVVQGQQSRVAEPADADYIVFWPIGDPRLATNIDVFGDCTFFGQVTGSTLNVTSINFGVIQIGGSLYGSAVPTGTAILSQLSGTASGGVGTYSLGASFTTGTGTLMAAGALFAQLGAEVDVQVDVHGPTSHDNSTIFTTLFRDQYAIDFFKTYGTAPPGFPAGSTGPFQLNAFNYSAIGPLHADDPRQVPFFNAEQQWENRWIITARLQVNQIVSVPQQFAGQVQIKDIMVDYNAQSQTPIVS
jgi:hypothetical protein